MKRGGSDFGDNNLSHHHSLHHHQSQHHSLPPPSGGVRGDEALLATIARGALRGLDYLHRAGAAHRDLKAANLLLGSKGEVIVADFGVAATLERAAAAPLCPAPEHVLAEDAAAVAAGGESNVISCGSGGSGGSGDFPSSQSPFAQQQQQQSQQRQCYLSRNSCVGTTFYMAPEVVCGLEEGYDAAAADIWSFGVMLLELATGSPPHAAGSPSLVAVALAVAHGEAPTLQAHCAATGAPVPSAAACEFAAACLSRDPAKRPSAATLLQHRFLRLARDDAYVAAKLLPGGCKASGLGGAASMRLPPPPPQPATPPAVPAASATAAATAPSAASAFASSAAVAASKNGSSGGSKNDGGKNDGGGGGGGGGSSKNDGGGSKKTKEVHSLTWQVPSYAALAVLVSGGSGGSMVRGWSGSGGSGNGSGSNNFNPLSSTSSPPPSVSSPSSAASAAAAPPPPCRELRLEFTAWFGKAKLSLGGHVLLTKRYSLLQSLRFSRDEFKLTIPSLPSASGDNGNTDNDNKSSSSVADLAGSTLSIVVTVGLDMDLHGSATIDGLKLPGPRTRHEKVLVSSGSSSSSSNSEKSSSSKAPAPAPGGLLLGRPLSSGGGGGGGGGSKSLASSNAPASRSASQALSASSGEGEGGGGMESAAAEAAAAAAAAAESAAASLASLEGLSLSEPAPAAPAAPAAAPMASSNSSTSATRLCAVPEDASAHAGSENGGGGSRGSTRGVAPREVGSVSVGDGFSQSRPSPTSVASAAGRASMATSGSVG